MVITNGPFHYLLKFMNHIFCCGKCHYVYVPFAGKKGYEVLVQGGVIDDLAKHMIEQYGIPKRYIEVLDKTRK